MENKLRYLYPDWKEGDWILRDDSDGVGPKIISWNRSDNPPSDADIKKADIAYAKIEKWESIKKSRDLYEFSKFSFSGMEFDGDAKSKSRIADAVLMAILMRSNNQPFSINWTLSDNSVVNLDYDKMIGVGLAAAAHVNEIFEYSRIVREIIDKAETLEDINSIKWNI